MFKGQGVSFMTSEAKIGLLLGLVVIVIIALVVNGVPSFHKNDKPNEMTEGLVSQDNNPTALGLGVNERQLVNNQLGSGQQPTTQGGQQAGVVLPGTAIQSDIRSIQNAPTQPTTTTIIPPQGVSRESVSTAGQPPARQNPQTSQPQQASKTYTVKSGDSLSSIAIQFYGQVEGNRLVNVDRIYNANKTILKSRDEIIEGQKLVIPPLPDSQTTTTSRPASGSSGTSGQGLPSNTVEYVIAEGDNLWKIAEAKLGSGARYPEITKLNPDIKDENRLQVGMKIKLPPK